MSKYFYRGISRHYMNKFVAVRKPYDVLHNIINIMEISSLYKKKEANDEDDYNILITTGVCNRILVRNVKLDGFSSMHLPFQVNDDGDYISFTDKVSGIDVDGVFMSCAKNIIDFLSLNSFSYDDIVLNLHESFGSSFTFEESVKYADTIISLLINDHGYFRFDDDEKNENGRIHPRYHLDFFCNNSTNIKIGSRVELKSVFFVDLFDISKNRPYLN